MNQMEKAEQKREELYRRLPSVNEVLLAPDVRELIEVHGHERVVAAGFGRQGNHDADASFRGLWSQQRFGVRGTLRTAVGQRSSY